MAFNVYVPSGLQDQFRAQVDKQAEEGKIIKVKGVKKVVNYSIVLRALIRLYLKNPKIIEESEV